MDKLNLLASKTAGAWYPCGLRLGFLFVCFLPFPEDFLLTKHIFINQRPPLVWCWEWGVTTLGSSPGAVTQESERRPWCRGRNKDKVSKAPGMQRLRGPSFSGSCKSGMLLGRGLIQSAFRFTAGVSRDHRPWVLAQALGILTQNTASHGHRHKEMTVVMQGVWI